MLDKSHIMEDKNKNKNTYEVLSNIMWYSKNMSASINVWVNVKKKKPGVQQTQDFYYLLLHIF